MRGTLRKVLLAVLALVVLGALIYRSRGIIRLQDFSWTRLVESVQQARGWLLAASVVLIYICYAIRALRWVRFSRYLGPMSFLRVYSSTLIGFSAIFLLGRAGEPVRPLVIARKERLPVSSTFGIYALERIFDTASTAVIAGVALLVLRRRGTIAEVHPAVVTAARSTGLVLLVGLIAAIAFLAYFRLHGAGALERQLAGWRTRAGWRRTAAGISAGFSEGLQAIRGLRDLLAAVAYSTVHWALIALVYVWIAHSFGGRLRELDFTDAMLVLAFSMVGSTLQLPGVGGGSQVAAFLAFTQVFGVEKEPAAAAAIVLWLITFAASSLAGVPLLIREGWSMGELRRLARAKEETQNTNCTAAAPLPSGSAPEDAQREGEPPR